MHVFTWPRFPFHAINKGGIGMHKATHDCQVHSYDGGAFKSKAQYDIKWGRPSGGAGVGRGEVNQIQYLVAHIQRICKYGLNTWHLVCRSLINPSSLDLVWICLVTGHRIIEHPETYERTTGTGVAFHRFARVCKGHTPFILYQLVLSCSAERVHYPKTIIYCIPHQRSKLWMFRNVAKNQGAVFGSWLFARSGWRWRTLFYFQVLICTLHTVDDICKFALHAFLLSRI